MGSCLYRHSWQRSTMVSSSSQEPMVCCFKSRSRIRNERKNTKNHKWRLGSCSCAPRIRWAIFTKRARETIHIRAAYLQLQTSFSQQRKSQYHKENIMQRWQTPLILTPLTPSRCSWDSCQCPIFSKPSCLWQLPPSKGSLSSCNAEIQARRREREREWYSCNSVETPSCSWESIANIRSIELIPARSSNNDWPHYSLDCI